MWERPPRLIAEEVREVLDTASNILRCFRVICQIRCIAPFLLQAPLVPPIAGDKICEVPIPTAGCILS
jgi:hypothetical protein